jgi:hypothetical protein
MNFRSKADRTIDRAHHQIASAEMMIEHAFTAGARQEALDELFRAQRFLRRAVETKRAWNATSHDDHEEYPDVPETDAA